MKKHFNISILLPGLLALGACLPVTEYDVQERSDLVQRSFLAEVDRGLSDVIEFEVGSNVDSLLIEVLGQRGRFELEEFITPNGEDWTEYRNFHASRGLYPGLVNWLYPNAPELEVQPGTYRMRIKSTNTLDQDINTEDLEVRIYIKEKNTTGRCGIRLDYLVDAGGVDPEYANDATELITTEVINHFAQAGISIIDYSTQPINLSSFNFDVSNESLTQNIDQVLAEARRSNGARREAVHIVMAGKIGGLDRPGSLDNSGYAMGEPGPYEANRPTAAVMVATEKFLKSGTNTNGQRVLDTAPLAITLTHEIGHYLGLPHTSNIPLNNQNSEDIRHDHIDDTAECTSSGSCSPEFKANLMSSGANVPSSGRSTFTPGQIKVMKRHPLCVPGF